MVRSGFWRRVLALQLCVLWLQSLGLGDRWGRAFAAEPVRLVLLPPAKAPGSPDSAPGRLEALLVQEVSKRPGLRGLTSASGNAPAPSAGGSASNAAVKAGQEVAALLDQGKAQLGELRFDAAAQSLQKGIDGAMAQPAHVDMSRVLEAHVSLAVAYFRIGKEEQGQATLAQLARLSPAFRLPEGRFPPVFLREFEKARKRVERLPKTTLDIDGPAGANAYLDGRELGMVPVSEMNVPQGAHVVVLDGTRRERWGQVVEVLGAQQKVVGQFGTPAAGTATDVASTQTPTLGPVLDSATASQAAELARTQNAQAVLVSTLFRTGEHQLTVGSALYVAKRGGFVVLPRFNVDANLSLSAAEVFRWVDAVEEKLGQDRLTLVALPVDLAEGAVASARFALSNTPDEEEVDETPPPSAPLLPKARASEDFRARPLVAAGEEPGDASEVRTGIAWWVYALGGVGLAAAAAGTYYGVSQATKPVSATVKASW